MVHTNSIPAMSRPLISPRGGKMDKFLGVLSLLIIIFGILNSIREIILLLEEINKKLSDKG